MVLLALLPLIVVIAALVLGIDIIVSALCGLAVAVAYCLLADASPVALSPALSPDLSPAQALGLAGQNALILAATVALVLIPGQAFNLVLDRSGALKRITAFVAAQRIDAATKALIIVLGLVPAIESLTGFGVSLFVMVPIVMHLFPIDQALRLSLLSMNIMPWGTLALATVVGAQLAGQSADELGLRTAFFSAAVFPLLGAIAAHTLAPAAAKLRLRGILLGLVTGGGLIAGHFLLPVDGVGIAAGLLTTLVGYVLYREPKGSAGNLASLLPYALLLALLMVTKLIVSALGDLPRQFAPTSGNLVFAWYSSPGIALLMAAAISYLSSSRPAIRLADVFTKVARPLLGISIFILLSQVMMTSGAIARIAGAVEGLDDRLLYGVAPLLGSLSGYITGSNLGGNVLMMPIQLGIAAHTDLGPWIAAVQNATAGHTLLASLPMIMLVLAIADAPASAYEQPLVRFSFKVLVAVTALSAAVLAIAARLISLA